MPASNNLWTAHSSDGSYSSGALDVDLDQTLIQVERNMPVRLIATLENLVTTIPGESVCDALEKVKPLDLEFLPVRKAPEGAIVGIVSTTALRNGTSRKVGEIYESLGPDDLISAEAPLLEFVWNADRQPRRLVLEGIEIRGIVTLSDIQKLPVRMSLFGLFIHFELLLTEQLRWRLQNKNPLELLSSRRREVVEAKWHQFADNRLQQDIFNAMDICDKRDIAMKLKLSGKSASAIESSISNIEKHLRNPIAHGAEYAISQEAALRTVRAAQETRAWIVDLRNARDRTAA